MSMLKRDIDVIADFVEPGNSINDFVSKAIWVEVKNSDPFDPVDFRQLVEEFWESELFVEIIAVLGDILGDEVDFFAARSGKVLGFLDNALNWLTGVTSTETGNGAEGTAVIAPFTHFEIGTPGPPGASSGGDVGPSVVRWLNVNKRFVMRECVFDHLVESSHLTNADISISSWSEACEFASKALGEAPGNDYFSISLFGDGLADGCN